LVNYKPLTPGFGSAGGGLGGFGDGCGGVCLLINIDFN